MDGYLGVLCVGLTETFKPMKCVLTCRKMDGGHTEREIIAEYESLLEEWKLNNNLLNMNNECLKILILFYMKVKRVVTDNAANMKKTFSLNFLS